MRYCRSQEVKKKMTPWVNVRLHTEKIPWSALKVSVVMIGGGGGMGAKHPTRVSFSSWLPANGDTSSQISCEISKYFEQLCFVESNIYLDIDCIQRNRTKFSWKYKGLLKQTESGKIFIKPDNLVILIESKTFVWTFYFTSL